MIPILIGVAMAVGCSATRLRSVAEPPPTAAVAAMPATSESFDVNSQPACRHAEATKAVLDPSLYPTRMVVWPRGTLRIAFDGPILEVGVPDPGPGAYPVVEGPPVFRILADQRDVRLLLYVDPEDVVTVVAKETRLEPLVEKPARATSRQAGVTVYPGLVPVLGERRNGRIQVSFSDEHAAFNGWVPAHALGSTYVPVPFSPVYSPSALVRAQTRVFQTPAGSDLAVLKADTLVTVDTGVQGPPGTRWVSREGRGRSGSYDGGSGEDDELRYRIEGFAKSRLIKEVSATGEFSVHGNFHGGIPDGPQRPKILRNAALLYDRQDGVVVGTVLSEVFAFVSRTVGDWAEVLLDIGWRELTVWVRSDCLVPICR